jgi:hypothetical protein
VSTYSTTFGVGDPDDPDDEPGVVLIRDGGNNHWPSLNRNRRGTLSGAQIPSWCVPGHHNSMEGDEEPGGWYRLAGCSWRCEPGFTGERFWLDTEYLLDEDAARALRDDIQRWLDRPKTLPSPRADLNRRAQPTAEER